MSGEMLFSVVPMEFDLMEVVAVMRSLWPEPARITQSSTLTRDWYVEIASTSLTLMLDPRVLGIEGDQGEATRFVLALKDALGARGSTVWFTDAGAEQGRPLATMSSASDVWSGWSEVPDVADELEA